MKTSTHVYGIRAVIEAIKAEEPIDKVYLQKGLQGSLFHELETLVRKSGLTLSYVPVEKLNRLTKNNHQGTVAVVSPITFHPFETLVSEVLSSKEAPLFLLLDGLSDVRNFGAVIRTAECTGVDGIIIPKKGAAPVSADTIKTSAGAAFRVPISKVDHLKDAVYYLQASGVTVVAATEKADKLLYDVSYKSGCAIVMGSEDTGIHPSLLRIVDAQAKLPMFGEIGSLNVSVACGVFLYEAVRQRMK
jgi:23S rRNA (guanosine2251-2'-O)-methyltransferase